MTTAEAALAGGAVQLSDDIPGNIVLEWQTGDAAATRRAFDGAAHVTRLDVDNHRIVTNPMEPRGAIGVYDGDTDAYTLHVSSQSIHAGRDNIAACSAFPRNACASSRPMWAAASAPRTFPMWKTS